jgi:hypothetical protein
MNGFAIRRRLARRLVPEGDSAKPPRPFVQYPPPAPSPLGTVIMLFDGKSFANWRMSGRGTFRAGYISAVSLGRATSILTATREPYSYFR